MLKSELLHILSFINLAFGSVTTIFIIVRSIKNYRLADAKKSSVIIRFTLVILIWIIVSLYFELLLAANSIGDRFGPEPEIKNLADAAEFIVTLLLWLLIGSALMYWTSRPPKTEDIK